jgi:hypothetical protein
MPTIFMVAMAGLALLSVVVIVSTGSITSLFVVLTLLGILGYVLYQMGYFKVNYSSGEVDISFFEKTPSPSPPTSLIPPKAMSLEEKEVFYVSGNEYTYDEASAVCAAYDAELATYDQVNDAYSKGGEWCGYGWTQGGMALYPTQQSTWDALQQELDVKKRTGCGRPGINGGYFDPQTKFGVNCYGIKPSSKAGLKFPLPIPGTDSKTFNNMVQKFKNMIGKMSVSPFNRDGWSEWNISSHGGSQALAAVQTLKKDI